MKAAVAFSVLGNTTCLDLFIHAIISLVFVLYSLCLQDPSGSRRHAVDAPVRVAMFVTYGDREATIIGSYHRDGLSNITRNVQLFVFTSIGRLVLGSIWSLACKKIFFS